MTNDNFKQILNQALKPIKDEQAEFRKEQAELKKRLDEVSDGLSEVKDTIESRVLPPLIYVETTVKGYADMYKINVPPEFKLEPLPESPFPS